ncbi:uncharacterized protein PHACADRAFT_138385 [Phanerochaete carnosa HHB-10118-sp]|uniref:Uncharacterized protein n=1 Tax=Phanerochaete carnosa (strain HHB-10118-sp) TaxID=650164 RepID=K5WLD5_PHACS|nr:uncharacterized protein PHACADRAFT_138385 [Phanerochaete carnosa HHB-10118-sp]EKM59994.1 hypothetical protein PHACADRAFT_138385 [Phanerochaete carnosa HHB-10118-sp]
MLSRRILYLPHTRRIAARATAVRFYNPDQKGDTFDQAHHAGRDAKDPRKSSPLDAANVGKGKKAPHNLTGNKEGLGFAEQVGSQSATGSNEQIFGNTMRKPESVEGYSGQENITPPSFADAVKSKLGFKTTAGEDKQNRGGGVGVTGTGQATVDRGKRMFHTSAVSWAPDETKGQAPEASRQPKDSTYSDQNAHLKHKGSPSESDHGKGNAAREPKLPSQHVRPLFYRTDASWKHHSSSKQPLARGFSTSACASTKHTADSYFKDVDGTDPTNPKVHQVDPSNGGAPVARANEQPATGNFSRSGPDSPEYDTVSKHDQPYETPPTKGTAKDQKLRYGAEPGVMKEEPSKHDEGPAGKDAGGRKPEGQS